METQSSKNTPPPPGFPVPLCNEISSILIGMVLTSQDGGEELRQTQADIRKQLDSFERFDVVYKQNTTDELHIAVPSYDEFDELLKQVSALGDDELQEIAGGEIILSSTIAIIIGKIGLAIGIGSSVSLGMAGLTGTITGVSAAAFAAGLAIVGAMVAAPVAIATITAGVAAGIGVGIAAGVGAFDSSGSSVSVGLAS